MAGNMFDDLTRTLESTAHRRGALRALGGLTLGSLGVVGLGQAADAQSCKKRCKNHCGKNKSNRACRNTCQWLCKGK
jgi:hypothetical protein